MDKEYGQKAPTLPDGTQLLNEVAISSEHTEQMKSDRTAMRKVMRRTFLTTIILLIVGAVTFYSGVFLIVMNLLDDSYGDVSVYIIGGVLLGSSWLINSYAKQGRMRVTLRLLDITKASKAAAALLPYYVRYMPGNPGLQNYTYMRLVMDNDSELGTNEEYRVRLDTSNDSSYVLREIIAPKAA